jgi:hypothetical protein
MKSTEEVEAEAKEHVKLWRQAKMDEDDAFDIASKLVHTCFRNNTIIEAIHADGGCAGMSYDDEMKDICNHPELGYASRISDVEMKRLMQEATANVMDALMYPEKHLATCAYMPVPDYWSCEVRRYEPK